MHMPLKHPVQYIKNEIRIQGFYSIYYFEHGKKFYHTPEQHNTWEMVYVDQGQIIAITEGIGCTLDEGMAIFHEPNEIHTHISNGEVSNKMFVISFVCDSPAMQFFKKKTFVLDDTSKTLLKLFMQEAKNELGAIQGDYYNRKCLEFNYTTFGATQLMANHFEEFLIKLMRLGGQKLESSTEARQIATNSTFQLVDAYLRQSLNINLRMKDICNRFCTSKTALCTLFKKCADKSPMQHYTDLKIDEAKKLLRDDNLSVSEIADALGYSGIHSFSRAFKASTGFSPRGYKKSILY